MQLQGTKRQRECGKISHFIFPSSLLLVILLLRHVLLGPGLRYKVNHMCCDVDCPEHYLTGDMDDLLAVIIMSRPTHSFNAGIWRGVGWGDLIAMTVVVKVKPRVLIDNHFPTWSSLLMLRVALDQFINKFPFLFSFLSSLRSLLICCSASVLLCF